MRAIGRYVWGRLKEPSTWAGITMIGALAGIPPDTIGAVQQVLLAIGGAIAVFLPDPGMTKPELTRAMGLDPVEDGAGGP